VSENAHQVALLQLVPVSLPLMNWNALISRGNFREDDSFFRNNAGCNAEKKSDRTPLEQ
jgi:hypothetical protein